MKRDFFFIVAISINSILAQPPRSAALQTLSRKHITALAELLGTPNDPLVATASAPTNASAPSQPDRPEPISQESNVPPTVESVQQTVPSIGYVDPRKIGAPKPLPIQPIPDNKRLINQTTRWQTDVPSNQNSRSMSLIRQRLHIRTMTDTRGAQGETEADASSPDHDHGSACPVTVDTAEKWKRTFSGGSTVAEMLAQTLYTLVVSCGIQSSLHTSH